MTGPDPEKKVVQRMASVLVYQHAGDAAPKRGVVLGPRESYFEDQPATIALYNDEGQLPHSVPMLVSASQRYWHKDAPRRTQLGQHEYWVYAPPPEVAALVARVEALEKVVSVLMEQAAVQRAKPPLSGAGTA